MPGKLRFTKFLYSLSWVIRLLNGEYMDSEARALEIQKVVDENIIVGSKSITYKNENKLRDAYQIPVEALIFNL